MDLETFARNRIPSVEHAMQRIVAAARTRETAELHAMMAYHMGWQGPGAGPAAQGKRIRPLLVLLAFDAAGGGEDTAAGVPGAAAVELLHNFSLIHDDIQDNSPLRRGRETVWTIWGVAQAINAGDAMYTLAYRALLDLAPLRGPEAALEAQEVLARTCIALTHGQYLDLSFENRSDVSLDEYWAMISGKTAALLGTSAELGALAAGAPPERREAFREFGRSLGLAFQVQDDLLGIWGDERRTGKSAASDLVAGKKSLPVIFGLEQAGAFARQWQAGSIDQDRAAELAGVLAAEGARQYAEEMAQAQTARALTALETAEPEGPHGGLLAELANILLGRQL